MTCFKPLTLYALSYSGSKPEYTFSKHKAEQFSGTINDIQVPCGKCLGCRLDKSQEWATRAVHEASLWENNCFITLTYDNEHLPSDRSLNKKDFQDFMKRFRKRASGLQPYVNSDGEVFYPIRYFYSGEYGDQFNRPHFHALIFNYDFSDKYLFKKNNGNPLYRSTFLEELWPFGFSSVANLTYQSAAYVARYTQKKVYGEAADEHYVYVDPSTGECHSRLPEFADMSRRPGIGAMWYDRFSSDVFPSDECIIDGKPRRVPKYYLKKLRKDDPDLYSEIIEKRQLTAFENMPNSTPERLAVREEILNRNAQRLIRPLNTSEVYNET